MNSPDTLTVKYRSRTVGTLSMAPSGSVCTFRYHPEWLGGDGFSISPLDLPLSTELFVAKPEPFNGNFGIFEDSLPDGYGRYLLHKMLKQKNIDYFSLSPLQLLSIVGESGFGALDYLPSQPEFAAKNSAPDFDELQQKALAVLGEKTDEASAWLYYNSGNSGGCRPKCVYADSQGHWLVKFRHTYDPADMGEMEFRYNQAARKCGIEVPDFKLLNGKYFASRRFDIGPDNRRLHVATAAALLGVSINPPNLDYRNLLHLTGFLTQDTRQVEEMFRRMVFNVLADNKDDHAKNFSFICEEGKWRLAPAYDLTLCTQGYHGERATSVNFNGRPSLADMLAVAESVRLPASRGRRIIAAQREILGDFFPGIAFPAEFA